MNVSRVNIKPGHPEFILGLKDKDEDSKSLFWAQRTWSSALLVPGQDFGADCGPGSKPIKILAVVLKN